MRKTKKGSSTQKKSGKNSLCTGKKKKKNRRELVKNPNLSPQYNLKSRTKLIDQDYLHKLNKKELEFLNKFNAETISAALDVENLNNNLYAKTKEKKKECQDANNARNRDILTKHEAMGIIQNLEDYLDLGSNTIDNLELLMDLKSQGYIDEHGEFTITLKDLEDK